MDLLPGNRSVRAGGPGDNHDRSLSLEFFDQAQSVVLQFVVPGSPVYSVL